MLFIENKQYDQSRLVDYLLGQLSNRTFRSKPLSGSAPQPSERARGGVAAAAGDPRPPEDESLRHPRRLQLLP